MPSGSFSLSGEIDLATAPALRHALCTFVAETTGDVVLDCADLTFLDCCGIGVLVVTRNRLANDQRRLEFLNLRGSPQFVLEILGIVPSDVEAASCLSVME